MIMDSIVNTIGGPTYSFKEQHMHFPTKEGLILLILPHKFINATIEVLLHKFWSVEIGANEKLTEVNTHITYEYTKSGLVPNPNEVVGGSIPSCEIVSLLD